MRLLQVDWLRGLAVLLVVAYHYESLPWLNQMGWIGVNLFFVISGFLVSGLLFKEYQKYGDVKPKLFLIRRGFKIYPLFYFFMAYTIIHFTVLNEFELPATIYELTFVRNYLGGYWVHTWSLCVEEQFYILITLLIPFLFVRDRIYDLKQMNFLFIIVFIVCHILKGVNVMWEGLNGESYFFNTWARYAQTQYRIDELLYGVFLAYNYYFNRAFVERIVKAYKIPMLLMTVAVIVGCTFTGKERAFINFPLAIAFGNLFLIFLLQENIVQILNTLFTRYLTELISTIGVYSYSIYLFHPVVKVWVNSLCVGLNAPLRFFIYATVSCLLGALTSKYIEMYFLKIRDKYFPARSSI